MSTIFPVDFNEAVENNLVLFSNNDFKTDYLGEEIEIREGMAVTIYARDGDDDGTPGFLAADGVVERLEAGSWLKFIPWGCRFGPLRFEVVLQAPSQPALYPTL